VTVKYYECIFGLKDMFMIRAVANTYLKLYNDALNDFKLLESCLNEEQSLQMTMQSVASEISES
jgi:hypothetical protein